jgi:hypothetical protein
MTGMPGPTVPQAPSRAGGRITPGAHHRPGNEGDGVHTYQPVVEETSLDHAVPVDSGINAEGDPVRFRQPLAFASGPGSGPVGVDSCAFFAAGGRTRKIRGCLRYVESLTVRGDLARGFPQWWPMATIGYAQATSRTKTAPFHSNWLTYQGDYRKPTAIPVEGGRCLSFSFR